MIERGRSIISLTFAIAILILSISAILPSAISPVHSSSQRLYALLAYDHPPTTSDVSQLVSLGLTAIPYTNLPYAAVGGTIEQITAAQANPAVKSLYWDRAIYPLSIPDTSIMFRDNNAYGTGATSVQADKAWNLGFTGQGITVAVIDTGLDTTNPSLAFVPNGPVLDNVQVLTDELLFSAVSNTPDRSVQVYSENQVTTDQFGHGTHVSGSVAGSGAASQGFYLGVAPGANLVVLDGLQCAIIGEAVGCLSSILSSFDWVLTNKDRFHIRVQTNSWESGVGPFDPNDPISVAVDKLVQNNITVLFAAGNAGPGTDTMSRESRNPEVIAVAAGQPSGGLADFSSRGIPGGVTPTVSAPGHVIISSRAHTAVDGQLPLVLGEDAEIPPQYIPNYTAEQGTSMATPITAGAAALALSANPGLSPSQVKSLLQASATPMLGYNDFEVGAGFVNAEAAVRMALGKPARVNTVKLPAETSQGVDSATGALTLAYHYRASTLGLGAVGFAQFPFSFPVYTNDPLPLTVSVKWDTVQQYTVYTSGYRVIILDPTLTEVARVNTGIGSLKTGISLTLNATVRAQHTPATGAYWYLELINFNPGWGVLDFTSTVSYPPGFKPPFKTTILPPAKLTSHPDKSTTSPGGGFNAQGSLDDANGDGMDDYSVSVQLTTSLGVAIWTGTTTTANGYFTTYVPVPTSALAGAYTLKVTAGGFTTANTINVDAAAPVLSSLSVSQTGTRSFRIQTSAIDNTGVGYVAVSLANTSTGATEGTILSNTGKNVYTGTIVLGGFDPVGTWDIQVYALDLASNSATITTSLLG